MGRLNMFEELENQYSQDLIKAISETKDGEVGVVQTPFELVATSTLYK